jgi:hypothetical protein
MRKLLCATAVAVLAALPIATASADAPSWFVSSETESTFGCQPYILPTDHLDPLIQVVKKAAVAAPAIKTITYKGEPVGVNIFFFPKWKVPFIPMFIMVFNQRTWCEKFVRDDDGYASDPGLLGWAGI